jgi:flagellar motility protein MotE (MotC chaperone)
LQYNRLTEFVQFGTALAKKSSGKFMKFIVKILLGLILMILNLVGYVFLFSMSSGLKPAMATKYIKAKYELIQSGKAAISPEIEKANQEKQEFEKSKQQLESEQSDLKTQKLQLVKDREDLEAIKRQIDSLRVSQSKAVEDKMYNLAKIFDGMDKQQAAKVFAQMEDSLVISILPKMKPTNASLILQYMEPVRSAQITKLILSGI